MSDRDVALARALADACLGENAAGTVTGDLREFLARRGVHPDDVEAIALGPRRLGVYRTLIRNGLSAVVLRMLPRTRARLNAANGGRFDADFAAFVDAVGPRTHYLRDVPGEFVAWAAPRWHLDSNVPPYLLDLATHELAHFAVAAADVSGRVPPLEAVGLERTLVFSGSTRLLHYAWAVHELPDDEEDLGPPERRDVHLLAYRDDDHAVRWLELTPLAAAIVANLQGAQTLAEGIRRACADHGPPADPQAIARLLADLAERGVLLGAAGPQR